MRCDRADKAVHKIILAEPRSFCAGVDMAIKALIWLREAFPERRVICYHEIVHNRAVVDWFERRGVTFVDSLAKINGGVGDGDVGDVALMLSAHGSTPAVLDEANRRFDVVVDAVCPLVRKVHREMERQHRDSGGSTVVYLCEPGSHDEAVGTLGRAPDNVVVVHGPDDLDDLGDRDLSGTSVSLLTQTTLPHELHLEVRAKLEATAGHTWVPSKDDLCFATTNRQAAVRELAPMVDAMIVVGSPASSNTKSLVLVAQSSGIEVVHRINDPDEIPTDLSGVVGVTAGASAPEELVQRICDRLAPTDGVEIFVTLTEDEYFPLPPSLRAIATRFPDRSGPFDPEPGADRNISASKLMASL